MPIKSWRIPSWAIDPDHQRRIALLAATPLFVGLRRRMLGRLAVRMSAKAYAPGETVFREGDPGRALFVTESGEVEVVRAAGTESEVVVARFGPQTSFGELALLDELPRSASARAVAPTTLLILYRTNFDELLTGDPAVGVALCRNLLRTLARYVRSSGGTLASAAAAPAAAAPAEAPQ